MHIRKYLSIFLIGLVFAIAGCSGSSSSGSSDNELLPDTDNDGIVDKNDPDIDGDGSLNKDDTDDDGDGTPDATDPTPNGPGGEAPTPGLACTSAKIIAPSPEAHTGSLVEVAWTLLPDNCGVQGAATGMATATALEVTKTSLPVSPGATHVLVRIPHKCSWDGTQDVTYSISQIGTALGDPSADTSHNYKQTIVHPVRSCGPDPVIADANIGRLSSIESCTQDNPLSSAVTCTADTAGEFWLWTLPTSVRSLGEFKKPVWSTTGSGHVHIYLTKTDACEKAFPGEAADGFSKLSWLFEYRGTQDDEKWDGLADACTVRTTLKETPAGDYISMPQPGNFILKAGSHTSITITKFSAGELN